MKKDGRIFGHVPGYPEGSLFESRAALAAAGVHRPTQAGSPAPETRGLTLSSSLAATRMIRT